MTSLELLQQPQETKAPTDDYDILRQQYHSQAFELGVNMLGYMGTPTIISEPGKKTRRVRTTNKVPLTPDTSVRLQYVEIGDDGSDLPTKEFEVLFDRGDGTFEHQATLKNPAPPLGATAIAYKNHILHKNRPAADDALVEMLTYMRDELQANSARFR